MHEGVQVSSKLEELQALLAPVVVALGYECWGIEFSAQGRHSMLRVYIDKEGGVLVDDCAIVSRQISGVLDVEDPISVEYTSKFPRLAWNAHCSLLSSLQNLPVSK